MNDLAPEARERTCFAVASEVLANKGLRKRTYDAYFEFCRS
jgi:hypothetical protein